MRIEQTERKVYQLDELPADIQEDVLLRWRENAEFPWDADYRDSLSEFQCSFPVRVTDWCVDPYRGGTGAHTECTAEDDVSQLKGVRLWKWLNNNGFFDEDLLGGNCPFTGFCADEDLLDPIRSFRAKPSQETLEELLDDCVSGWVWAYARDLEHWHSEEAIREDITENGYEFLSDGSLA